MSSPTLPPSPGSASHPATDEFPQARKPKLKACTLPPLSGATVSSEHASKSELRQSPTFMSSEPSAVTVIVDSPQSTTHRLSPTTPSLWRPEERWTQFPTPSRSNSLMSEGGKGFEEWRCDQAFQFEIPKPKANPWEAVYKMARDHDRDMCDVWREGIDKLLIFAGLFSAALVAFLTVSCPLLNPNPSDIQNALLLRIALHLESGANNVSFVSPPPPPSRAPFPVTVANICWFFSLTISLGTVLFGTVCLQWIIEFERKPHLGFKEAFEFRQMRYEGLIGWGIPFILSSLPLLLQLSLLLFFLGLGFFLQSFDPVIAAAISVLIALIVVFLFVTMMLPAMQCIASSSKHHDLRSSLCPFKSPHARLFVVFAAWSSLFLIDVFRAFSGKSHAFPRKRKFLNKIRRGSGWTSVDRAWLETSYQSYGRPKDNGPHLPTALGWLAREYAPSHDALCAFYHCLRDIDPSAAMDTLRKLTSESEPVASSDLNWTVDYDIEHSKDIQSAFALDVFVKASPQLHDSLLSHRVELFVRILNQELISRINRHSGQTADVCSLFERKLLAVPFVGDNDFVALEDACKFQLVRTFLSYLEVREIHNFLADIVIKMIHKTMTTKPLPSDQMLRDEFSEFNKKLLGCHLNAQGTDKTFSQNVEKLITTYIDQFGEDGYKGKASKTSSFKNSLGRLASVIRRRK